MKFLTTSRVARAALPTTPERGADQLVRLAEGRPGTDRRSGEYYAKRRPGKRLNRLALDTGLARQLWEHSEALPA
jgi:hypothetical protein